MPLKETVRMMKLCLDEMGGDLDRADTGNKAASQRVRTASIRFAKLAKLYRKESITAELKTSGRKKS